MGEDQRDEDIVRGLMADGMSPYVPGMNCWDCGRFVGRDGWIEIEHREMSRAVASVSGQCRRCGDREAVKGGETRAAPRATVCSSIS